MRILKRRVQQLLGHRLAGDAAWATLDAAAGRGLQLLAMLMAARLLGPRGFGEVGVLMAAVVSVSAVIGDSMRFTAATQLATALHRDASSCGALLRAIAGTMLLAATACAALVAIAAEPLAARVLDAPHLAPALRIAAALLWLECLAGVATGALQALRAFRPMALTGLTSGLLSLPAVTFGAYFAGTEGVMAGLASVSLMALLVRTQLVRRHFRGKGLDLRAPAAGREWDVLRRVGLPGVANGLMAAPVNALAMLMLVHSPGGYVQAGLLGAANQWFAALLFLPGVAATITLPWFAEAIARGDRPALRRALVAATAAVAWAVIPAAALVALASPLVMQLYGDAFRDGWPTLALLALAATLASTLNMLSNLLASAGRWTPVLVAQAAWGATYLGAASLLLGGQPGSFALAVALAIAYLVRLLVAARAVAALLRATASGAAAVHSA